MSRLRLTLACGPYDRTDALQTGVVQPEGIDLLYLPIQSPPELFARMVHKTSFDVAEMSLSLYLQLRSRGDFPFVALPVFPSRMFRHSYVFVNSGAGIESAADLAGKRIGVQEYHQTAGVWIRGILSGSYGVDFSGVSWFEGGVNAPRQADPAIDLRPAGDLDITFIGSDTCLDEWLAAGRIDAYFGARAPRSFRTADTVQRLFGDARAEELSWFRQTGVFPIMHTLVVREDLLDQHPWIAETLFKAFEAAKRWCLEQMRFSGTSRYSLPWMHAALEEVDELFGGDPYPYGLDRNRAALEMLAGFLVEQQFVLEAPSIDAMFAPIVLPHNE